MASILVNINCWKESEVWTKASCPATRSATVFLNYRFLVFRVNSRICLPIGDSSTYYYFSWRTYWKQPIKFSSRVGQEREYKIALSRNTEDWLHYTTISKGVSLALMLPFVFAISYFLLKKELWFWKVTNYENNRIIYNNDQVLRVNNKALEGTSFSAPLVNNKLVQTRIKQCQQKMVNDEKEFIRCGLFTQGVLGRKRRLSTPLQVCLTVSFFKVLSCKLKQK